MADEQVIPTDGEPTANMEEGTKQLEQSDVDSLMAQLEEAGAANSDTLQGKLKASQEVGRMGQLLGEERNKVANLEGQLNQALVNKQQPAPQNLDIDNYSEGQTVDLEKLIEQGFEKVWTKKERQAEQVQRVQQAQWSEIHGDTDYELVKEVWEARVNNPQFVAQVQAGKVHPLRAYNQTVREYYKGIAKQSRDVITQLQKGVTPPPYMEQGERTPNLVGQEPRERTTARKTIDALHEKSRKGLLSEDEELDLAALPFLS